jgi:hypothetical protein
MFGKFLDIGYRQRISLPGGWISGRKVKISGNFLDTKLRRGNIRKVYVDLVVPPQ